MQVWGSYPIVDVRYKIYENGTFSPKPAQQQMISYFQASIYDNIHLFLSFFLSDHISLNNFIRMESRKWKFQN